MLDTPDTRDMGHTIAHTTRAAAEGTPLSTYCRVPARQGFRRTALAPGCQQVDILTDYLKFYRYGPAITALDLRCHNIMTFCL